jgi:hypothetical protein
MSGMEPATKAKRDDPVLIVILLCVEVVSRLIQAALVVALVVAWFGTTLAQLPEAGAFSCWPARCADIGRGRRQTSA